MTNVVVLSVGLTFSLKGSKLILNSNERFEKGGEVYFYKQNLSVSKRGKYV